MPTIKLPDGKNLSFSKKITGLEIAEKISKSLSKQALVMSVDDQLKDLSHLIENDCSIKIFTSKDSEGLETIRHDTAHILAMAVQELFPGTQVTIGPVIENGFYYDFARKESFTQEDLNKIENKMKEIVDRNEPTFREVWKRNKAISHFKENKIIFKKINKALKKGGRFVLYDLFLNNSKTGPYDAALFAITMLLYTKTGKSYAFGEVDSLLRNAGFARIKKTKIGDGSSIIEAIKI